MAIVVINEGEWDPMDELGIFRHWTKQIARIH